MVDMKANSHNRVKRLKIKIIIILAFLCLAAGAWLLLYESRCDRAGLRAEAGEENAPDGLITALTSDVSGALNELGEVPKTSITEWVLADHVYSHRGSAGANELSFEAYDAAIEAGSHNIEQDIVISKDGTLYVSHDMNAAAMTGYGRAYADMTDAEIDALTTSTGNKILKLSDVFDHYQNRVRYVIELKSGDTATVDAFKATVDEYDQAGNVVAQSFEPDVLRNLEEIYPEMPKMQLCRSQGDFDAALNEEYADEICVNSAQMTQSNCDAAHERDKRFSVWTLDSEGRIKDAISIGADAYFTNDTPLAIELEHKYRKVKIGTESSVTTVLLTSDYQNMDGFDSPKENLRSVVKTAINDGRIPDMAILCGDYTNDASLHDYQLSGEESIEEIREVLKDEIPTITNSDMLFVQGNHDAMSDSISKSGLHEYDNYLVYVLNTENDFPWKQGKVAGCHDKVKEASAAMKSCFDDLISKGETRPVFIAGHVPLHYTARTSSRHTTGDNLYASLLFDVVNEAADSLDIVYMYGHNHSKGWDCYMGGSCVYREAGDSLLLPVFTDSEVSSDRFEEKTLNFTYMNAGYVGYYMNCAPYEYSSGADSPYRAADETLTCTVCEIHPDRIEINRYDSDGRHVLGAAGEANPYKGGIDEGLIGTEHYSKETSGTAVIKRKAASTKSGKNDNEGEGDGALRDAA